VAIAGVVLALAAIGVFVWILRNRKKSLTVEAQRELGSAGEKAKLAGAEATRQLNQQLSENELHQLSAENDAVSRIKLPSSSRKTEVLTKHIREASHKDPVSTANVLRTWISDRES
jgi:flagellar biosynthesis/type III secretory pathway M-ring protein FliF/YscJ